ncbi:MAG: hypothetical protein HLX45_08355 [Bacillus sp. (in: Bacteria)]|nr:hypothetical protein [Bacillus sp. (in: firmicutes)]
MKKLRRIDVKFHSTSLTKIVLSRNGAEKLINEIKRSFELD